MKYVIRIASGLLSIALLSGATAAAGQQRRCESRLKSPDAEATVVGIAADGEDLEVVVAWNDNTQLPGSTKIRVRDPAGGLIASQSVSPVEGDVTTTLVGGVFDDLAGDGLEYRIEIGNGLADPHPFRVAVDCPAAVPTCVYTLDSGVSSRSAVPIDAELGALLDALGATPNALAVLLAADPTLQGEIATLALELQHLDQRIAIPQGGCTCLWTYGVERTPSARTEDPFEGLPLEEGGFEGPGAAHDVGAQSIGTSGASLTAEGTSRLDMSLRCWDFQPGGDLTVELPGGSEDVELPDVTACPASCAGEVQHNLILEARLAALAVGGSADPGIGAASQLADYTIDNALLLNELWSASAVGDAGPAPSQNLLAVLGGGLSGAHETDFECADRTVGQLRTPPSTAELHTFGNVLADGGGDAFGIAQTGVRYQMRAVGFAACALEPAWEVTVTDVASFAGEPVAGRPLKVTIQPYCWD